MQIFFLRHANAGEPKLNPAKDAKRPLDKLGIEQSHDVGRALAALDITVDVIISSPLRRATQTAAVVANEIDHEEKVVIDNALRPGATYAETVLVNTAGEVFDTTLIRAAALAVGISTEKVEPFPLAERSRIL